MTTEQKTEWYADPEFIGDDVYDGTRIYTDIPDAAPMDEGDTIAIEVDTGSQVLDKQIAERITRAVNSHNDLLAACEAALKLPTVHDSATCTDSTPCPACKRRESIRTAIAKATK